MRRWSSLITCLDSVIVFLAAFSVGPPAESHEADKAASPSTPSVIWHSSPPGSWIQGYPLGNGILLGMVCGGLEQERIGLNHTWLWRHKHKDERNPQTSHKLAAIRKLFFAGKLMEAAEACCTQLGVQPWNSPESYQPAGDLLLQFPGHGDGTDYRRELDLSAATASISYRHQGVRFVREALVSQPEGLLAVKIGASKPGAVCGKVELSRSRDPDCAVHLQRGGHRLILRGSFPENVRFAVVAAIRLSNGAITGPAEDRLAAARVEGADEMTVLVAAATNQEADDPARLCHQRLDRAMKAGDWNALRKRHVTAHQRLFHRVDLDLHGPDTSSLPTDRRLTRFAAGQRDPQLERTLFDLGRYLVISGSQPGGNPMGLFPWNESLRPPWSGDYHHDVDIEMAYWSVEVCNLPECAQPFFDYVDRYLVSGRQAAKDLYGCRGVYIPLTGDPWAQALKTEGKWSEWTGAAAWLALHYWEHYLFTGEIGRAHV